MFETTQQRIEEKEQPLMIAWYDRFKGELIKELPEQVMAGRYIAQEACVFNGHTIQQGDLLFNDGTEKFHVDSQVGSFINNEQSEQIETELEIIESAILAYQEAVDSGSASSFLIPDKLLARFELTQFEGLLFDTLKKGHLQEIARRPRMELIYEEHLVPVSRAKKIAGSANAHLASHSECWQTRTLTGVLPKQVLALESEDQINIYENRVYVKLLKYIEQYLVKRVLEVRKLEEIYKKAMKFQDAEDIHFELRESIFSLWGEGFSDNTQADDAAEHGIATLDVLTKMLKKVRALQQTKLYQALTHNVHVPLKLNMTNVLSHDQHYRHVARLWNSWLDIRLVDKIYPEQILLRNMKLANAYSLYCCNLMKKTLKELGFNEFSLGQFVRSGSPSVCLKVTDASEILLETECQRLCFVPFFTNIPIQPDLEGEGNNRVALSLFRGSHENSNTLCLSPTNFYSLEQLALLISKWLASQTYSTLGLPVPKIPLSLVEMLRSLNTDNYWKIENNNVTTIKPCLAVKPRLVEFREKNSKDVSICRVVDTIIESSEKFEGFLFCPCCGAKTDESQWISREDNCFSIRNSSCNHSWEVNRQANGKKVLKVTPNKTLEEGWTKEFACSGRYSFLVSL